jgi:hypothetical protein
MDSWLCCFHPGCLDSGMSDRKWAPTLFSRHSAASATQCATCTMFLTSRSALVAKDFEIMCSQRESWAVARTNDSRERMMPTCPHIVRRSEFRSFSVSSNRCFGVCRKAATCPDKSGTARRAAQATAATPARMPKTSPSNNELLASRLAPCTPLHATSPAAKRPGKVVAPLRSVQTPPIM